MAESEEELKSLLMKMKEEREKAGLNQHSKIMACGPITSWKIDEGRVETVADFISGGSKNHCRWWLQPWNKRHLLLGRKVMTNLDSILKSRDITLLTRFRLVKAMVFPVVMYACEIWTIELSSKELMLLNCGVGEDSLEFLGLQGDPTSPFWRKSALGFLWKEWC